MLRRASSLGKKESGRGSGSVAAPTAAPAAPGPPAAPGRPLPDPTATQQPGAAAGVTDSSTSELERTLREQLRLGGPVRAQQIRALWAYLPPTEAFSSAREMGDAIIAKLAAQRDAGTPVQPDHLRALIGSVLHSGPSAHQLGPEAVPAAGDVEAQLMLQLQSQLTARGVQLTLPALEALTLASVKRVVEAAVAAARADEQLKSGAESAAREEAQAALHDAQEQLRSEARAGAEAAEQAALANEQARAAEEAAAEAVAKAEAAAAATAAAAAAATAAQDRQAAERIAAEAEKQASAAAAEAAAKAKIELETKILHLEEAARQPPTRLVITGNRAELAKRLERPIERGEYRYQTQPRAARE